MASHDDEISAVLARIALAGDGIVLGVGIAALAVSTWMKFHFHSSALKKLHITPSTPIPDLRFLVPVPTQEASPSPSSSPPSSSSPSSILPSPSPSPSPPSSSPLQTIVVVRGRVHTQPSQTPEYLTSQGYNGKTVIVERTQTCLYNEWRGFFGWGPGLSGLLGWGSLKERAVVSISKIPFVLKEGKAVAHINLDNSCHPLPLVTVYQKIHPVKASPYTFLQALFGRGYPVGFLDEEKILPVGKEITAVGLLSFAPNGEPILMASNKFPYFLTSLTREELIADIASSANVLFWAGIVVSTCTVGILSYAFFKNWKKWKQSRQLRRIQEEQARDDRWLNEAADGNAEDLPDEMLCVVCLMRRRRAAFLPCGHLVCCMGCAQRVEQDMNCRCPVCRNPVNGLIRIYDA